jgi:YHS domain-containing protein
VDRQSREPETKTENRRMSAIECVTSGETSATKRRRRIMATDPVCQMDVEEHSAAGQSTYDGKTYYFCSPGCREAFEKDPGRYLPKTTDLLGRNIHSDR